MLLSDKIKKIIVDNKLSLKEFYKKTGLSATFYYSIKEGRTTSLQVDSAKKITDAFPEVSYEWLMADYKENNVKPENKNNSTIDDIISEKVAQATAKEFKEIKESIKTLLKLTQENSGKKLNKIIEKTEKNISITAILIDELNDKCDTLFDKMQQEIKALRK